MAVLAALVTGGTGAPLWEKPSLFLGSLDLDGGLRQRFELGVLGGSPEFALPVFLEHGFRGEEPVSEYRIPQLETYVVPEGREQILWLEHCLTSPPTMHASGLQKLVTKQFAIMR